VSVSLRSVARCPRHFYLFSRLVLVNVLYFVPMSYRTDPAYILKMSEALKRYHSAHPGANRESLKKAEVARLASKKWRKSMKKVMTAGREKAWTSEKRLAAASRNIEKALAIPDRREVSQRAAKTAQATYRKHNGVCAICEQPCRLCKDHCHSTGRKRGTICHICNFGLGNFKDNVQSLKNAIQYLYRHTRSDFQL